MSESKHRAPAELYWGSFLVTLHSAVKSGIKLKLSGQSILWAENRIEELEAVVDRLADSKSMIDKDLRPHPAHKDSFEVRARIEYAAKHATEKE